VPTVWRDKVINYLKKLKEKFEPTYQRKAWNDCGRPKPCRVVVSQEVPVV
jgi:hypothetical protein